MHSKSPLPATPPPSDTAASRPPARKPGGRWLRRLAFWTIVSIGGWWSWPHIQPIVEAPFYFVKLSAMEPPSSLAMPVQGVSVRSVADTWGAPRSGGRRHEGLDIFAPRGTPVLSATEGVVSRVGTNRLGGNVVWVIGPSGQRHYYAHLDRYADGLTAGDRVQAGTVIGHVGDTGNARGTPPHLHYGVYGSDGAFNPYPLLKAHTGP